MNRLFITFMLSFFSMLLTAQNIVVSGVQNGVWEADTVIVNGDVYVADSLVIAAGTKVVFCGEYSINVRNASLKALGTANDSVIFEPLGSVGGWNGIKAEKSFVELDYCSLNRGRADADAIDGGAVRMVVSVAVFNNCTFKGCSAYRAGGAVCAMNSKVDVSQCEVCDNVCANEEVDYYTYGAGMFFAGSVVSVNQTSFRNNSCVSGCGGGVCVDSSSIVVTHCMFEDNNATNGGGISCIRADDRPISIDNVLIDHNTVVHYGGAMHIAQCYNVRIDNVTMCDNICYGGGGGAMQFHLASKAVINNSIIWGNGWDDEKNLGGDQIWLWDIYSAPEFHNCLLQGGVEGIHHSENVTVYENMLDEDPLFSFDYHLSEQSPCRNAGDSSLAPSDVTLDLEGLNRFSGTSIDMGAYEYQEGYFVSSLEETGLDVSPIFTQNRLTHVKITIDRPCELNLSIKNILGQTLWQSDVEVEGEKTIAIDGITTPQPLLITAMGEGCSKTVKCVGGR